MTDIQQIIDLRKEELARQVRELDNPELQKKIEDYKFWSRQLPILKAEIEALIGVPLEKEVNPKAPSDSGRKKGVPLPPDADIDAKIDEILKASAVGLSGVGISNQVREKYWPKCSEDSFYQRVSKILGADQTLPEGSRKYRRTGEKRNTNWFAAGL